MTHSIQMNNMNRRRFLQTGATGAAGALLPGGLWAREQEAGVNTASLVVHTDSQGSLISPSFLGLSYESSELSDPEFFSPRNVNLVALFRRLGPHGVLRLGGNNSDSTIWIPGDETAGPRAATHENPGGDRSASSITPLAIRNLAAFLDAVDWDVIYGLNFGRGTAERAAEEAALITQCAGARVIALQLGNEPDVYNRFGFRPPEWAFADFTKEWNEWVETIRKRVPYARFGGPDVTTKPEWAEGFPKQVNSPLSIVTSHYYALHAPKSPQSNAQALLSSTDALKGYFQPLVQTAVDNKIPYRMTEGNSCSHGGKHGLSDVFASALWAADFMFQLAQCGVGGVNFHGGGTGFYTPIEQSNLDQFTARPIYFGMLLFSYFCGTSLLPLSLNSDDVNLRAYAAKNHKKQVQLALVNRDLQRSTIVRVNAGALAKTCRVFLLSAPSVESGTGILLGGAAVASDGSWKPTRVDTLPIKGDQVHISLPAASAAFVLFD